VGFNLGGSAPVSVAYDAFDRAMERYISGSYKQVLYRRVANFSRE
jgi:hypothetical protein